MQRSQGAKNTRFCFTTTPGALILFWMSDHQKPPPPEFLQAINSFQQATDSNNTEQMEAAALAALEIGMAEAEKNPAPKILLRHEAAECAARGNWSATEACYRKLLTLEEADGNAGLIAKVHLDLSRLFFLRGDLDCAEASAKAATCAARDADNSPMLCVMLENQVLCALHRSDNARALAFAEEAVAITKTERIFDNLRAGAWVARAQCRLAIGDVTGAESDLLSARPMIIDKPISPLFAGLHGRVAKWWEVTAELRAHQGDHRSACEAWVEAVKTRRHIASLPQVAGPHTLAALARTLSRSSKAYQVAADPAAAESALDEARCIYSQIRAVPL